jgi:hypothetical protein
MVSIFTWEVNGLLIFPYGRLLIHSESTACSHNRSAISRGRDSSLTLRHFYGSLAPEGSDVSGNPRLFGSIGNLPQALAVIAMPSTAPRPGTDLASCSRLIF